MKSSATVDEMFLRKTFELANTAVGRGLGGPFGALVAKGETLIAQGYNQVSSNNDPTAHAEVVAIRKACKQLQSFQLDECTLYSSCEPCPMCLGAIYWARPAKIVFACSRFDAADAEFDDAFLYGELLVPIDQRKIKTIQLLAEEGKNVLELWKNMENKVKY